MLVEKAPFAALAAAMALVVILARRGAGALITGEGVLLAGLFLGLSRAAAQALGWLGPRVRLVLGLVVLGAAVGLTRWQLPHYRDSEAAFS